MALRVSLQVNPLPLHQVRLQIAQILRVSVESSTLSVMHVVLYHARLVATRRVDFH